jgi:hypothetical protein
MGEIYDLSEPFPFHKLELTSPINTGGNYAIKLSINDSPVYIQSPKCVLKQGFLKTGKKMYCDLVFSNENEKLITWIETFETTCQQRIFENRTKWFENDLDEHDIENYMTSPYKIYKSGKMYIIRTVVPAIMEKCDLKIYNEHEKEVNPDDLKENTEVITILEFKGIKCSVRSFQFDIEIKQMLVLAPVKMFDKCIIHRHTYPPATTTKDERESANIDLLQENSARPDLEEHIDSKEDKNGLVEYVTHKLDNISSTATTTISNIGDSEIMEVDFDLEELDNTAVHLKKRDDVYYKMYKEAKQKAREAKMIALSNYLEAKRIKTTYLLNDEVSDDSDLEDLEEMK